MKYSKYSNGSNDEYEPNNYSNGSNDEYEQNNRFYAVA